jgi:PRTRC genetic system protein C
MLTATIMPRVFLFELEGQDVKLPDPDDKWTPQRVLDYYTGTYPALTTAKVSGGEIEDDQLVYRFETTIGTKG